MAYKQSGIDYNNDGSARLSNRGRHLSNARDSKARKRKAYVSHNANTDNALALRTKLIVQPRTKQGSKGSATMGSPVSAKYQGRMQSSASRLPGSWSDTFSHRAFDIRYSREYFDMLLSKPRPFNPNAMTPNQGTLRYWGWSKKLGKDIRRTKRYSLGDEPYQAPAPQLVMRGVLALFDECVASDSKYSDPYDAPVTKHMPQRGDVYNYPGTCSVGNWQRRHVIRPTHRIAYHVPIANDQYRKAECNGLVRHVRPADPELGNMLRVFAANAYLRALEAM